LFEKFLASAFQLGTAKDHETGLAQEDEPDLGFDAPGLAKHMAEKCELVVVALGMGFGVGLVVLEEPPLPYPVGTEMPLLSRILYPAPGAETNSSAPPRRASGALR